MKLYSSMLLGLLLTGCANTKTIDHSNPIPQPQRVSSAKNTINKNPIAVTFYHKGQKPRLPYKILGTETVSKFNLAGIKRQEAGIQDTMRNLAAAMGGDAVINIVRKGNSVIGTVIAYQDEEKDRIHPLEKG